MTHCTCHHAPDWCAWCESEDFDLFAMPDVEPEPEPEEVPYVAPMGREGRGMALAGDLAREVLGGMGVSEMTRVKTDTGEGSFPGVLACGWVTIVAWGAADAERQLRALGYAL